MRIEVLRKSLFETNDKAASENRRILDEHGVVAVNIMGGAGCGKTTLLEGVIPHLRHDVGIGVLEGDLATTKDAQRIAALDVPVVQLLTEGGCHLTATLVEQGLARLSLPQLDHVLIENVGNPICPVNFDLGEYARLAVLSVAEGDDKPAKYPYLYKAASRVVITKCDLLESCSFDLDHAVSDIHALNPDVPVYATSRKDFRTMMPLVGWLRSLCNREGITAIGLRHGAARRPN